MLWLFRITAEFLPRIVWYKGVWLLLKVTAGLSKDPSQRWTLAEHRLHARKARERVGVGPQTRRIQQVGKQREPTAGPRGEQGGNLSADPRDSA